MISIPTYRPGLIGLSLCLGLASSAHAAIPVQSENLGFGLLFFRDKGTLDYPGGGVPYTLDGVTLRISEGVGAATRLYAFSGQASLKQRQRPLTAGMSLSGLNAGLGLQRRLYRSNIFSSQLDITYRYLHLDEENSSQKVELTLHSWQIALGIGVQLNRDLRLIGGGTVGGIDGEEVASGSITQTLSVDESKNSGGFVRLDWRTDATGHVGIEWHDHLFERVGVYFTRDF